MCSPSAEELTGSYQATRRQTQERSGFLRQPLTCTSGAACARVLQHPGALLTALTQHPASHTPSFCSGIFQNSPVSISFAFSIPALRTVSPQIQFPTDWAWTFFAQTIWHGQDLAPSQPCCSNEPPLTHLQRPELPPPPPGAELLTPVTASSLARTERLVLSTRRKSTCGKGVKSTFLQLSSEKRGSQVRI